MPPPTVVRLPRKKILALIKEGMKKEVSILFLVTCVDLP